MGRAQGIPGFRDPIPAPEPAPERQLKTSAQPGPAPQIRTERGEVQLLGVLLDGQHRPGVRQVVSQRGRGTAYGDGLEVADDAVSVVTLPSGNCSIAQEGDSVEADSQVVTGVRWVEQTAQ